MRPAAGRARVCPVVPDVEERMRILRWAVTAILFALLPTLAAAQSDAGRVTGTVRDSSGAFVGGATVKVRNTKTGETRTVVTDQSGVFFVTPLKPSTYTITAEKPGFAT